MAAAIFDRFNDQEYKNWLKIGQCLLSLRDGLCSFVNEQSERFHRSLLAKYGSDTCQGNCKGKDILYDQGKKIWELKQSCPNQVCNQWIEGIIAQHQMQKSSKSVYWTNCTPKKWPSLHWEVAKVFMSRLGSNKTNSGPKECDCAALLNLFTTCKFFDNPGKKFVTKATEVRNKVMHSSTMKVDQAEMEAAIDKLLEVLEKPEAVKVKQDAQEAAKNIKKIKELDFDVSDKKSTDDEAQIMRERIVEMEDRLSNLEEKESLTAVDPEVKAFLEFVKNNPDLAIDLEAELSNFRESLADAVARLQNVEHSVECMQTDARERKDEISNLKGRMDVLEKVIKDIDTQVPRARTQQSYCKNQLQEYVQSNLRGQPLPKYTHYPHPGGGFVAEVTVGGKTYSSKTSHFKKVDADQDAAEVAIQCLGLFKTSLSPVSGATDNPLSTGASAVTTGVTAVDAKLAKLLEPLGCEAEEMKVEESTGKSGSITYRCVVKVHSKYLLQLDDLERGKKNAEHKLASQALVLVGETPADDMKGNLQKFKSYCEKNGYTTPQYQSEAPEKEDYLFTCYVSTNAIQSKQCVSVKGKWQVSVLEAEENICTKVICLLRDELKIPYKEDSTVPKLTQGASRDGDVKGSGLSMPGTDPSSQTTGDRNFVGELGELLQSLGCQAPIYEDHMQDGAGNFFQVKLRANIKHVMQLPEGEAKKSKKEADQALAGMVLESLNIPKEENKKQTLNQACQTKKYKTPFFHAYKKPGSDLYCSIVVCEALVDPSPVTWIGDKGTSKKDAKKHCAKGLISVLEDGRLRNMNNPKQKGEISSKIGTPQATGLDGKNISVLEDGGLRNMNNPKQKVEISSKIGTPQATGLDGKNINFLRTELLKNQSEVEDIRIGNPKDKFQCELIIKHVFCLPTGEHSAVKKEAEKKLARYVLSKINPQTDTTDLNKCKNLLQELCTKLDPTNVPKYVTEQVEGGTLFTSRVTLKFGVKGEECSNEHVAKEGAAKEAIRILELKK